MKRIIVLTAVLIILYGCTSYELSGKTKRTMVDKISADTIMVTFCGNAYMGQDEVEKYALQRASTEALSKGCPHFVVVKKEDNSKICALSSRKQGIHSYDVTALAENPENLDLPEFVEPNVTLTIQCISKGEKIPENAINAEEFLNENFPGINK